MLKPTAGSSAGVGSLEGSMPNLRAMLTVSLAVASRLVRGLIRVAKRWAAPGAGPKLVTG